MVKAIISSSCSLHIISVHPVLFLIINLTEVIQPQGGWGGKGTLRKPKDALMFFGMCVWVCWWLWSHYQWLLFWQQKESSSPYVWTPNLDDRHGEHNLAVRPMIHKEPRILELESILETSCISNSDLAFTTKNNLFVLTYCGFFF